MGTNDERQFGDNDARTRHLGPTWRHLASSIAIAALLGFSFAVGTPAMATVGMGDESGVARAEASGGFDQPRPQLTTPLTPMSSHGGGRPDRVADFVGGIAARLHSGGGDPIPGDLFLLMAVAGSDADAQLFDHTPYGLDRDQIHLEAAESNLQAVRTVEGITGASVQMVDFTSAPGGGPSAGITYAIGYLNIISDGAFTGGLVVAATGSLGSNGYVDPINSVNEKLAAADLAEADVLFTPSIPTAEHIEAHGTRVVGELFRARNTGSPLGEERQWEHYDRWGSNRPDDDIDVVGIRHIGDVAAYLCGAGSDFACDITLLLENVTDASRTTYDAASVVKPAGSTTAAGPSANPSLPHLIDSAGTHPISSSTRRDVSVTRCSTGDPIGADRPVGDPSAAALRTGGGLQVSH